MTALELRRSALHFPRAAAHLHARLQRTVAKRPPDFVIGRDAEGGPYLRRWYITPWRGWYRHVPEHARTRCQRIAVAVSRLLPNLYLHQFLRDDDDRALHDHPSWAVSFMLDGAYIEHTIAAGGIQRRHAIGAGALRVLPTLHTHRIELPRVRGESQPCWTLFMFGPTVRQWGFHCPQQGWVHWEKFTAQGAPGEIGGGCGA